MSSRGWDGDYGENKRSRGSFHDLAHSKVLHVRGLPLRYDMDELLQFANSLGKVVYFVQMINSQQALLEMETMESAVALVDYNKSNPITINGTTVNVNFSKSQELNRKAVSTNVSGSSSTKAFDPNVHSGEHVVLMTIINPLYPVDVNVLHTIVSPHGRVRRIVVFHKNGVQALVELDSPQSALRVKEALDDKDIYDGCCTLKIVYSNSDKVNVKYNDDYTRDFERELPPPPTKTAPPIPVPVPPAAAAAAPLSAGPSAYGPSTMPPYPGYDPNAAYGYGAPAPAIGLSDGPAGTAAPGAPAYPTYPTYAAYDPAQVAYPYPSAAPSSAPTYPSAAPSYPPAPGAPSYPGVAAPSYPPAATAAPSYPTYPAPSYPHSADQSTILQCSGLDAQLTPDRIFNLFCMYGNVQKIKLGATRGTAQVQMADRAQCDLAVQNLNGCDLFQQKLTIVYSEQGITDDGYSSDGTPLSSKDFSSSLLNRFSRVQPGSNPFRNVCKPTAVVHFSNAPPLFASEDSFRQFFSQNQAPSPLEVRYFEINNTRNEKIPKKIGLLSFSSTEHATEALVLCNNLNVDGCTLKLAFSTNQLK